MPTHQLYDQRIPAVFDNYSASATVLQGVAVAKEIGDVEYLECFPLLHGGLKTVSGVAVPARGSLPTSHRKEERKMPAVVNVPASLLPCLVPWEAL